MKNEYKDMFKYLENNGLGISSLNLGIIETMDLNDPSTLLRVQDINNRYENSSNKYSENIMEQLRQRLGLDDKYDTSIDREINNMSKDEVFTNLFGWNGLRGWDSTIKDWVEQVYGIKLSDEN
ncbi:hypothetical protein AB2T90_11150 [Clostridium butyricum]|uniref:hypothetical protein n=1 Tax=Clostridium butyricum TaxID=1492 RepID=UPI003466F766